MSWLMEPIYNIISWVLLRWHDLWDLLLPDGRFLGTTWEWVLAIVFLVVTVRLVLFPIFVKQIKSQRAMQALAPKIRELQAKHKGDQQTLREEMMKLYQQEKVNPLMGCLPMFLQIPVFFGLFHVLRYINPLTAQPINPDGPPKTLYGWSEEQFDSAAAADLFTAPIPATFADGADKLAALGSPGGVAAKIVAAVLVLIMMFTTFMTSRQMILKTGWQAEPQQRMIQKLMLYGIPVSLLLSGWYFPIGVVIYWVTQNLISLGQQQWVLRKYPPMVTASEPPKSARERAAAANKKEPGAIKRFFLVLPPPAKPAGAAPVKRGLLARFRPGSAAAPVESAPSAPRALAPRPGAKPRPVTATSAADTDAQATETTATESSGTSKAAAAKAGPAKSAPTKAAPGKAVPGKAGSAKTPAKATPAKATPAKAAATKSTPAKAGPSKQGSAKAVNGEEPAISVGRIPTIGRPPTVNGPATSEPAEPATADEAAANGASVRSGASAGAGRSGGGRSGSARKPGPRRKGGQPARKGSGKR